MQGFQPGLPKGCLLQSSRLLRWYLTHSPHLSPWSWTYFACLDANVATEPATERGKIEAMVARGFKW
jgi:hypothetical protein